MFGISRWAMGSGLAVAVLSLCANTSHAQVIGDFEGGSDGWIDWGNQLSVLDPSNAAKYSISSSNATLHSSSLLLTKSGYNQDLAIKLEGHTDANGGSEMADFFANNAISMDITTPASTTGGYSQLYELALNAPGWGFKALTADPVPQAQWGWATGGGGAVTHHVVFDYSAAKAAIASNAGYAEFIFSTNNDGLDTHNQFYFDNVQLITVPEPASATLLGLGSLAMLRRRRRMV